MVVPWVRRKQTELGSDAVMLVTWFTFHSPWRAAVFLVVGLPITIRLWWQALRSPGNLGVSMKVNPFTGFWSLSAWTDRQAIAAYTRTDPHGSAMDRLRHRMEEFARASWTVSTTDVPATLGSTEMVWSQAEQRLGEERRRRSAS